MGADGTLDAPEHVEGKPKLQLKYEFRPFPGSVPTTITHTEEITKRDTFTTEEIVRIIRTLREDSRCSNFAEHEIEK